MKDNRSEKFKMICVSNIGSGCRCRWCCPLNKSCAAQAGDTKEIFDARMNKAAEELEGEQDNG